MLEKISFVDYSCAITDIRKLMHEMRGTEEPQVIEEVPNRIYRAVNDSLSGVSGGIIYLLYVPALKVYTFNEAGIMLGSVEPVASPSLTFASKISNQFYHAESYMVYRFNEPFYLLAAAQQKPELCVVIA